jgi:isoquinoline 1-oxidoreductase alpha subunit
VRCQSRPGAEPESSYREAAFSALQYDIPQTREYDAFPLEEERMVKFVVNGKESYSEQPSDTPLLWVIRDELGLTGTKFGCGVAQCGACTVHVNGAPTRSCITPVSAIAGKKVTTIEGLAPASDHPLQKAWIAEQVPQCGYCQSGQIMQAAALLAKNKQPTRAQIVQHMNGHLCRCGTYNRIVRAIERASKEA